jgi:hypothetical protein
MVTSAFWKTMMAEWGVGPGTHLTSYRVPTAAPASLDGKDIEALLGAAIAAGALPPPSASRIYAVYPPAGTTVTNFGSPGCTAFQAYHFAFASGAADGGAGAYGIYAVAPRCPTPNGMSVVDYTTWGMSHEIMEASSDPLYEHPAFVINEQTPTTPEFGENADLCAGNPVTVEGHLVTRNWSNVAAKAGQRPCVPAPPGPMFGAFADPGGVSVAPGGTAKVNVHLYTSAPMPAFTLDVYPSDPELSATLSAASGNNGDVLTLTVKASAAFVAQPGVSILGLYARSSDYGTRGAVIVHAK